MTVGSGGADHGQRKAMDAARAYASAEALYTAGEFDQAAAVMAQAERRAPGAPKARLMWCRSLVKARRLDEAAELLPELLRVSATDGDWQRALGRIAISVRHWETAIEIWLPLAKAGSDNTEPFRQLARAYSSLGQDRLGFE